MDDPGSQVTPSHDEEYVEDRRRRRQRGRLVGFCLCIGLWVLSVVPLARDAIDEREGAEVVVVYLVAGALTLGIAAVIRAAYAVLRKRPFWSPWVFLIAAVLAIAGYAVQSAGDEVIPIEGAPSTGVAELSP